MKRRNFLYAGGALVCGAGIANAAGGWNLIQSSVEADYAFGTLNRPSDRLVATGLGPNDNPPYYARLITKPPEQQLFPNISTNGLDTKSLRDMVAETDFERSYLLLIQARMKFQDRFGIYPQSEPQWVGWRTLSIPLYTENWGTVQPNLQGANELVSTNMIRFKSETTPQSGHALLYEGLTGGSVQERISI
ncbi:hypothetical protein [Halococcus sp. IIIV-5B]|uniref:hypothetical protein n=1 Tax=Halococcus sp. IIIV-5B TaxID=2321230 RepID=UPI001314F375|nr:hypothetical protein [Halococcus sp. IIIV-5B]